MGAILFAALILAALVLSNQPMILYAMGVASAVGVLLILMSINTMAMLIILKRDSIFDNWRQIILPLSVGLVLALTQLIVIGFIRYEVTGTLAGFPGI